MKECVIGSDTKSRRLPRQRATPRYEHLLDHHRKAHVTATGDDMVGGPTSRHIKP